MSKQTVNIGTNQDDGTGDVLRAAFKKINENFDEVYIELGGSSLSNLKYSGTTISTDTLNANIILDSNGTGIIQLSGPVTISETLGVTGNTTLTGTLDVDGNTSLDAVAISETLGVTGAATLTTVSATSVTLSGAISIGGTASLNGSVDLGDSSSDTITITGRVDSSIVPSVTETNSLGSTSLRWNTVYAKDGNFSGDITLAGNITVGDSNSDTISITADLTSNLMPNVTSTYDIGSATKKWRTIYVDTISGNTSIGAGNISISGSIISNTVSNANIVLSPMGTGTIVVPTITVENLTSGRVLLAGAGGSVTDSSYLTQSGDTTTVKRLLIDSQLTLANTEIASSGEIKLNSTTNLINVNDAIIDNVLTPVDPDHAANKAYVDAATIVPIYIVDDTSISSTLKLGDTLQITGGSGLATSVTDQVLTITNNDTWSTLIARMGTTVGNKLDLLGAVIDRITINENYITTNLSNADLELRANGTGGIVVQDSANFDSTVLVTGATTLSSTLGVTGDATFSGSINTNAIKIENNHITAIRSNDHLVLGTTGIGNVIVDDHLVLTSQAANPNTPLKQTSVFAREFSGITRVYATSSNDGTHATAVAPREATPASAVGAAGDRKGDIAYDTNYVYICLAHYDGSTAIWKRAAVATW
jgi:hypothetical protein